MDEIQEEILRLIGRRRAAPTTNTILDQFPKEGLTRVQAALKALVDSGRIVCTNGLWMRRDLRARDNRKPKGPKKLDPKSAEARTLPLEFYK